jgi:hypothetical protein
MKIVPIVTKVRMKGGDEDYKDMLYWLSKTPQERISAVTQLRRPFLKSGQRIDKTVVIKRKMHR